MSSLYHPVSFACPLSKTQGVLQIDGNLFLAPVAGYSDRAFRSLCVDGGANFAYTEMVSAEALVRNSGKTKQIMAKAANEKHYAIQIFGATAPTMEKATALILENEKPNLIDINSGCPVHKITKTGAGSALMKNIDNLYDVVRAVVLCAAQAPSINADFTAPIPVSVKIRSGWDMQSFLWKEAALAVKEAGAAAITIHPRTRAQGYEGKANWQIISELTELMHGLPDGIPVFGSGDVYTPEDARNMLEQTGCDAVMFARGAMGSPFIFEQTRNLLQTGTYKTISFERYIAAGLKELEILCADKGEAIACREMRKRFCAYTKGTEGGANLRKFIVQAKTKEDYFKIFDSLIVKNP
ncbi:MAG: tRNA dihydrouridine synthase DusB [Spirochaetales bacterium]